MNLSLRFLVFLSLWSAIEAAVSDDGVMNKYVKWMDKYKPDEMDGFTPWPTESNSYSNFLKTVMSMARQEIKFYTGRSQFLMNLNGRATDSHDEKAAWNGLKPTPIDDEAVVQPRLMRPSPSTLDYRSRGLVTPIVDQGFSCGSCYAFSAVGALEGQLAKKHGRLVKLSEQNIIDCSDAYGNRGCNYGFMDASFRYVIYNPGMANESVYPYTGEDSDCYYEPSMEAARAVSYAFLRGNEEDLKRALAMIGPLSVGIYADLDSMYFYSKGVYDDAKCRGRLNHAVTLVGYGTDTTKTPPVDYWIVKNSWSTDWGEGGYLRIKRGINLCGITNYVIYPII